MKHTFMLISAIIFTACSTTEQAKKIRIEWSENLEGNFSFKDKWSYSEAISKNQFGQLVCDGLCPDETYKMLDSEGRIPDDSLHAYYQLIDTTHFYHSIAMAEHGADSLWYLQVRQIGEDSIECCTALGVSTYTTLKMNIVNDFCCAFLENVSPAPDSNCTYPCIEGSLKIDKSLWKQGIMKAFFQFTFLEKNKFTRTGKIYAKIEN